MNFLLNILIFSQVYQNLVFGDVPESDMKINLLSKTYYLRELATMEVKFAQNSELVSNSVPEKGLKLMKNYMKEFMRANGNLTGFSLAQDAGASAVAILHNPIATFHMVRRFLEDLLKLKDYLFETNSPFSKLLESELWFESEDLQTAVRVICRISHVYYFRISDVADGIFQDIHTGTKLNARDCSEIGRTAPTAGFFAQSIMFMEEALERVEDGSEDRSHVERDLNNTIKLHDQSLKTATPQDTIYYFNRKIGPLRKRYPDQYKSMRTLNRLLPSETANENDLCLFGNLQEENVKKDLFCWNERTTDAYFTVNPLKMEVLSLEPELVQVYEIVGAKQIKFIKKHCDSKCIWNDTDHYDRQLIENVLIDESEHFALETMPKTLEKLTGLNYVADESSRNLRVITYPPGGQFSSHLDLYGARHEGTDKIMPTTFLYYLEEPVLGGATTFAAANLAVTPIRGSGIFYYNFRSDWSVEFNSKHSSCPIVLGWKRAASKTTYGLEQMLTVPCYPNKLLPYSQFPKSKIYQQKRRKLNK